MSDQPSVVVTGVGSVNGSPDQCVMTLGVNGMGSTAADALENCARAADRAIGAAVAAGVDRRDVRTVNLAVRDFFDQGVQKVTARIASYYLTVTVRTLGNVGRVVEAVAGAVGDGLQIQSLQLVVRDLVPLQREARRLAVHDARERAGQLAEAAGIRLGKILSMEDAWSTGHSPDRVRVTAATALSGAPLPMEPGEISTMSSVTIAYAIDS